MVDLNGKVIVITGSTRGFGWESALACGKAGAIPIVSSRSLAAVEQAISSLQAEGIEASGLPCNIANREDLIRLAQHAEEHYGRFDVWVNNAALSAPYGPTMHVSPEAVLEVSRTNMLGTYYGSLVAMSRFLPRGGGKLINILGRGARRPAPMQNAYSASKAWVRSFTQSLAAEYDKSGVEIIAFNPGMMDTDLLQRLEVIEGYSSRLNIMETVLRMWSAPPQVPAQKLAWLASDATDGKNGKLVREMSVGKMLAGSIKEIIRRITGRPGKSINLQIETVPAYDFHQELRGR